MEGREGRLVAVLRFELEALESDRMLLGEGLKEAEADVQIKRCALRATEARIQQLTLVLADYPAPVAATRTNGLPIGL